MSDYLSPDQVTGNQFIMARTRPGHFRGVLDATPAQAAPQSFSQLLLDSLDGVNEQQQTAETLSIQAVTDPDSVDVHDVTIAAAQASLSLSITKSIVDRVVQAYREIQNVR
jgi:flagellar hook-basal body complex protein FliE